MTTLKRQQQWAAKLLWSICSSSVWAQALWAQRAHLAVSLSVLPALTFMSTASVSESNQPAWWFFFLLKKYICICMYLFGQKCLPLRFLMVMNRGEPLGGGNHGCVTNIPSAVLAITLNSYVRACLKRSSDSFCPSWQRCLQKLDPVRRRAHACLHWFVLFVVMNIDFKIKNTASLRVSPLNGSGKAIGGHTAEWKAKRTDRTGELIQTTMAGGAVAVTGSQHLSSHMTSRPPPGFAQHSTLTCPSTFKLLVSPLKRTK